MTDGGLEVGLGLSWFDYMRLIIKDLIDLTMAKRSMMVVWFVQVESVLPASAQCLALGKVCKN